MSLRVVNLNTERDFTEDIVKENGTIGAFCKNTVVRERQCLDSNAHCNMNTLLCQCNDGYEMEMTSEKSPISNVFSNSFSIRESHLAENVDG